MSGTIVQDKLEAIERRYDELNLLLASPDVLADYERWQGLSREQAAIQKTASKYKEYKNIQAELAEVNSMLAEKLEQEMAALTRQEAEKLQALCDRLLEELRLTLLSKSTDGDDARNVIVEVRAGTGGDEAALFAGDLFRMYARYAQARGWEVEVMNSNESGRGGFKEIIFGVKSKKAYQRLKYEAGVHRVQRVPVTEASGRIHTSTATVMVLPEAEEVEVDISPDDLKMEFYHSGGPGGQNVNKVATAVRITHLPTGLVVTCQEDRSQLKNRMQAMRMLRTRLLDLEKRKKEEEASQQRRSQVGSGERAEKIRTYNFPQGRVTDHRVGLTMHNLPAILEGDLDRLIDALATHEETEKIVSGV